MKISILTSILILVLLFGGCKKEKTDLQQILTSTSWEETENADLIPFYSTKSLYKVSFYANGDFQIIHRVRGVFALDTITRDASSRDSVDPGTDAISIKTDTISGRYSFSESDNTIRFILRNMKVPNVDTLYGISNCDSLSQYIADWQIKKISNTILELQGFEPTILNNPNCIRLDFFGHYTLKPFVK